VVNCSKAWNTRYVQAVIDRLLEECVRVHDRYVARLSPLIDGHINLFGRYEFDRSLAAPPSGLLPCAFEGVKRRPVDARRSRAVPRHAAIRHTCCRRADFAPGSGDLARIYGDIAADQVCPGVDLWRARWRDAPASPYGLFVNLPVVAAWSRSAGPGIAGHVRR
jgi:hypothetical protein